MEYIFYFCKNLTSLNISQFDTSLVTNLANMFYECNSLKSLDLSNFNTISVKNMSNMFYNCYSLESLEINNFITYSVEDISKCFYNCSSLNYLNLKRFYTLNITNYEKIFENSNLYLQYCFNVSQTHPEIISQLNNFTRKNCSELCSIKSYKYINEKNKCINNCQNDDSYKYDYNDICYLSCPNGTYSFDHNQNCISLCEHNFNYNRTECLETVPI
jgi:surface protein